LAHLITDVLFDNFNGQCLRLPNTLHAMPNVPTTNPMWQTIKSPQLSKWFGRLPWNLERWRILTFLPYWPSTISKMQDGGQPPFWTPLNHYISSTVQPINTKSGRMTNIDLLNPNSR